MSNFTCKEVKKKLKKKEYFLFKIFFRKEMIEFGNLSNISNHHLIFD